MSHGHGLGVNTEDSSVKYIHSINSGKLMAHRCPEFPCTVTPISY